MSSTKQNLFPFTTIPDEKVHVFPCYAEFSAPVVGGFYVFDENTTPAVEFGKLHQEQRGVVAGVMISANCMPDDFAAAVDEPLKLQILHGGNNTPINLQPFPFTQFSHGAEFQESWKITASDLDNEDHFKIAITGKVAQIGNMNSNELKIKVAFNFLRVDDAHL